MQGHHNNLLSVMFMCDNRFKDLVQCVINYAMTFKLNQNVQRLQALTFDIARNVQLSGFIWDGSLYIYHRYTCVAKLFLKNENVFTFVTEKSKKNKGRHDLNLVHLGDSILFSSNEEEAKLVIMATDSHIKNPTVSAQLYAQSFYLFRSGGGVCVPQFI